MRRSDHQHVATPDPGWKVVFTHNPDRDFSAAAGIGGSKVSANCCEVQAGVEGGVQGTVPR